MTTIAEEDREAVVKESDPRLVASVIMRPPSTLWGLHGWLQAALGIEVPAVARCRGHSAPLDYLAHVFFEREGDAVVWANRGGGKTFYGAVATLLDLVFKPGVEVRLLGGSFDQSCRMYEHLRGFFERPVLRQLVKGKVTERGFSLRNGSAVEVLSQSETSVRGHRVQKLRCDEVEMFDERVWDAAQMVTRSKECGGRMVRGSVEALSTMHRRSGLMHDLMEASQNGAGWRVFKWCVLDVMQQCKMKVECEKCELWDACGGRARGWDGGFMQVKDVVNQRKRLDRGPFEVEMLCERAADARDLVVPQFDPRIHVQAIDVDRKLTWIGGMDFGMRNPLVMLWAQVRETGGEHSRVEVIDEYIASDRIMDEHLREIAGRGWPKPAWIGADPAGRQRSSQTGLGDVDLVRRAGYVVRDLRCALRQGLDLIRNRLRADTAGSLLVIHPRCRRLIAGLEGYRFDSRRPGCEEPVKDGHDHVVDALRYMMVGMERGYAKVEMVRYCK